MREGYLASSRRIMVNFIFAVVFSRKSKNDRILKMNINVAPFFEEIVLIVSKWTTSSEKACAFRGLCLLYRDHSYLMTGLAAQAFIEVSCIRQCSLTLTLTLRRLY